MRLHIFSKLGYVTSVATALALSQCIPTATAKDCETHASDGGACEDVRIYVAEQVTHEQAMEIVDCIIMRNQMPDETEGQADAMDAQQESPAGDGSQETVLASARSTPTAGLHQCSLWVRNVFLGAGQQDYGNTAPYEWYDRYCHSSDKSDLQPGMIVCTSRLPFGTGNGHVGIYIGDGMVMHNTSHWVDGKVDGSWVATTPLDDWIASYGVASTPRWGWLGGIALS